MMGLQMNLGSMWSSMEQRASDTVRCTFNHSPYGRVSESSFNKKYLGVTVTSQQKQERMSMKKEDRSVSVAPLLPVLRPAGFH